MSNEIDKLVDLIETARPDPNKSNDFTQQQHQLLLKEASQLKVLNQRRVGIIQRPLTTSPTTPTSTTRRSGKVGGSKVPLASSKTTNSFNRFSHRGQMNKNTNVTQNLLNRQQNSKKRQQSRSTFTATKASHVLANKNVLPRQRESANNRNQKSVSSKVLAATHQPSTSTRDTTTTTKTAP